MGIIKQINIKNRTYYFFNDMVNIKGFDSSLLKIDKKSFKNIGIYYSEYITRKDEYTIDSVNPLYLIVREIEGFIEEKEGSKYLYISLAHSKSEVLKKYSEIWSGIKNQIEKTNGSKSGEYGKNYMKIKFNSDNNLPLNKLLKLLNVTIIVRAIFEENGKYYPRIFFR